MSKSTGLVYKFDPFLLDTTERILVRDGRPISLKPKLFDLLLVLVENSGHILDKNRLMSEVWPDTFVEESNLTVSIFALRKALGEGHNNHSYIETVPDAVIASSPMLLRRRLEGLTRWWQSALG